MLIYAGTNGFLDDVDESRVEEFQTQFLQFIDQRYNELRSKLVETKALADDLKATLKTACETFKSSAWKK